MRVRKQQAHYPRVLAKGLPPGCQPLRGLKDRRSGICLQQNVPLISELLHLVPGAANAYGHWDAFRHRSWLGEFDFSNKHSCLPGWGSATGVPPERSLFNRKLLEPKRIVPDEANMNVALSPKNMK